MGKFSEYYKESKKIEEEGWEIEDDPDDNAYYEPYTDEYDNDDDEWEVDVYDGSEEFPEEEMEECIEALLDLYILENCNSVGFDIENDELISEEASGVVKKGARRLYKKKVIRNGKKTIKWFTDLPNMRVVPHPDGKSKRPTLKKITGSEKAKSRKSHKLGAIKAKASRATAKIKRRISKRFRGMFGLK